MWKELNRTHGGGGGSSDDGGANGDRQESWGFGWQIVGPHGNTNSGQP